MGKPAWIPQARSDFPMFRYSRYRLSEQNETDKNGDSGVTFPRSPAQPELQGTSLCQIRVRGTASSTPPYQENELPHDS